MIVHCQISIIECNPRAISEVTLSNCSASTEQGAGQSCQKAFDGNTDDGWATAGEGVGAWIKIDFDQFYRLTKINVMQRPNDEYFKDISLEFSDGTFVDYTLNYTYPSKEWAEIDLSSYGNLSNTNYVNISAHSVYTKLNNGFSEIKVFGCPIGKI